MVKTKFKPVLPSLREKKRYLVFEVISEKKVSFEQAYNAIMGTILGFMGQLNTGKAGVILLEDKWDDSSQRGMMKVGHKSTDMVKSALMFITKIGNEEVIVKSLGLSGILKKAQAKYLNAQINV